MAEQPFPVDHKHAVEASLEPIPTQTNPEMTPEKMQSTVKEDTEELEKKQTNKSDIAEPEYPPMAKVVPIVAALYMAFFLVALVRPSVHQSPWIRG